MSGGTINFSFLVGDKVRRISADPDQTVGEVTGVWIDNEITYYVKWPPNMYNPVGFVRGYDADDLESAT